MNRANGGALSPTVTACVSRGKTEKVTRRGEKGESEG